MPKKRTSRGSRRPTRRAARPLPIEPRDSPTNDLHDTDTPSSDVGRDARTKEQTLTVVGVGASAGGLEAFSQLLEHVAGEPGFAFVFVQHLAPHHGSALVELLTPRTRLPVIQATNGMAIAANHVYVVPPNAQMEVEDGHLRLLPRPTDQTQFTPIDFFFLSMARSVQHRAIGVVLSGTASDGASGLREIKEAGGITIAQRPESAKHDGMPRAAIATGVVDLVLTPAEIGEHLSKLPRHTYLAHSAPDPAEITITDAQMREVFAVLRRTSSVDFRQYKSPTVRRRILRRMALLRREDLGAYIRFLSAHSAEAKALSQDLLIHVTRFFRDPESFVALTNVLREFARDTREGPLRIWIPGCATGEEAYSVAICLLETLADLVAERRVQIFATDASDASIEQARTGAYPVSIGADVSPERLKRFFTKTDVGYRVVKFLRDICVFARHDLTRDPPFSRLNLIVCRNVLIYLDLTLQKRLISVFHYALKSRGYLMLGPAETPGSESLFDVVDKKWRIFRRAGADASPSLSLTTEPDLVRTAVTDAARASQAESKSVQDEATRFILERFGPSGVIVDANLEIVQFRGHTGPYLEAAAGEPSLNVLKMARGGLLHPIRTAVDLARRRARIVRKSGVMVHRNGSWEEISLEVIPLSGARGEHFLILFDEQKTVAKRPAKGRARGGRERGVSDAHVNDLRRELAANREYLQSIIQELEAANEELQSANEEILSSNEELQSTNEELDTAKEELQSTNEELNTVNEELHSRNEELTRVNSDLLNLLGSVDIPIVIVGNGMEIRRFTPKAEQLFNLIPGDIGRPIGQINPNFELEGLEELIRETIDQVAPREREVLDRFGRWQAVRIRPYKGVDNRLDGAVIAVIDVDAVKRYEAQGNRSAPPFGAPYERT